MNLYVRCEGSKNYWWRISEHANTKYVTVGAYDWGHARSMRGAIREGKRALKRYQKSQNMKIGDWQEIEV